MRDFKYLFITNKPEIAAFIDRCGVHRVFIDLEIDGKIERQGHLNTVISKHSVSDISKIKAVLNKAELLVRINPYSSRSGEEIDKVIEAGADIIMLPMFKTVNEVSEVGKLINGRVKLIPLVETIGGAKFIQEISELESVSELHIGLNDLHIEMKLPFMFKLLANGFVEDLTKNLKKPFGIGGIARVGIGDVPGELILSEHVRLGSQGVILSRAFHIEASTVDELNANFNFQHELDKLTNLREELLEVEPEKLIANQEIFSEKVELVISRREK